MVASNQGVFHTQQEVRSLVLDPAYTWRWALVLPEVKGRMVETRSSGGSVQSPGTPYNVKVPVALAESIDIPPNDLGVESRQGGATSISFPRHDTTNAIPVVMYEDYRYSSTTYLLAWVREIVDADEKGVNNFGNPADYKKEITFLGFDIKSNTDSIIQVQLVDCFPSPPSGLNYNTDNGLVTINTDFTVDGINISITRAKPYPIVRAKPNVIAPASGVYNA